MGILSPDSPEFTNEKEKILAAIDQVGEAVQNRGIWVIDCVADRETILEPLLQKQTQIRQSQLRDVLYPKT